MKRKLSNSPFLLCGLLLLAISCTKQVANDAAPGEVTSNAALSEKSKSENDKSDLLKSVKQATSRFHSTTQALKAGYERDDHCVSHPLLGGMGYHWLNPSLVDPVFDPLKPEVILYATGPDGNLRMVALEYIVINTGQPHPKFGDQLLDVGGVPPLAAQGIDHWSLHVWLYEHNPRGIFQPFNPNITCP
ncbi:hypothetical protein [Aridibaculum aurantiacum]|uniref:hypothetical protein n=1 Tax=Aridibaculum aurantiacum TaxID=2810307 RepID=UPI001A966E90|nr:hypothetical protein [Aridibaculum aurantiacum]